MRAFRVVLLILLLAGAHCGENDPAERNVERAVGNIERVLHSSVRIDGKTAASGESFKGGSLLSTDNTGAAAFRLKQNSTNCQLQPSSVVRFLSIPPFLNFEKGAAFCTQPESRENVEVDAGSAKISVRDAIFGVQVTEQQSVIQVFNGFAEVTAPQQGTSESIVLGPQEQSVVRLGQVASPKVPIDVALLEPPDREAVEFLRASLPEPDLGFPKSEGSAGLRRIEQEQIFDIALDANASTESRGFVNSFFGFLGQRWGVDSKMTVAPLDSAARVLRSGGAETAVSRGQVAGAKPIPFFQDERQQQWFLYVSEEDGRLEEALRTFLDAALENGEFGRQYREAFGSAPTYQGLQPLAVPSPTFTPSPSPSPTPDPSPSRSPSPSPTPNPTPNPNPPPPPNPPLPGPVSVSRPHAHRLGRDGERS